MSGISASYFLSSGNLASTPSTVLFYAEKDPVTDRIVGSFNTFGLMGGEQNFTIEILYPHDTNGIIQITRNVSAQVSSGSHIIIDANIDILPSGSSGSGFEADLEAWEDVIVPIPV